MSWQEMSKEIVMDLAQITVASPDTDFVIGIIQWHGKLLAGPVYQPNIFPLEFHDDGTPVNVGGVSILPEPEQNGYWHPIELEVRTKKNGSPTTEDMPPMYFDIRKQAEGAGLAFPSCIDREGRVQWSGNPAVIDEVARVLVEAGILRADQISG